MSHREALEKQAARRQGTTRSVRNADLAPVLERLIATLNRIEAKLDKI